MHKQIPFLMQVAVAAGLLFTLEVQASCEYLQAGLGIKMNQYRAYREQNTARIEALMASKAECDRRGAEVSVKASAAAAGESCTAQGEVASLNQSIEALGQSCEARYLELKRLQTEMKAAYEVVHDDLKEALDLIEADPMMKEYCGSEVQVASTMGAAFLALERGIVDTLAEARAGSENYSQLVLTGKELSSKLSRGNKECGVASPGIAARTVASNYGQGAGSATVTPIGNSPRPVSDISGTKKAIDDNARAEALIGN